MNDSPLLASQVAAINAIRTEVWRIAITLDVLAGGRKYANLLVNLGVPAFGTAERDDIARIESWLTEVMLDPDVTERAETENLPVLRDDCRKLKLWLDGAH